MDRIPIGMIHYPPWMKKVFLSCYIFVDSHEDYARCVAISILHNRGTDLSGNFFHVMDHSDPNVGFTMFPAHDMIDSSRPLTIAVTRGSAAVLVISSRLRRFHPQLLEICVVDDKGNLRVSKRKIQSALLAKSYSPCRITVPLHEGTVLSLRHLRQNYRVTITSVPSTEPQQIVIFQTVKSGGNS